jgi:hypothetical protein
LVFGLGLCLTIWRRRRGAVYAVNLLFSVLRCAVLRKKCLICTNIHTHTQSLAKVESSSPRNTDILLAVLRSDALATLRISFHTLPHSQNHLFGSLQHHTSITLVHIRARDSHWSGSSGIQPPQNSERRPRRAGLEAAAAALSRVRSLATGHSSLVRLCCIPVSSALPASLGPSG